MELEFCTLNFYALEHKKSATSWLDNVLRSHPIVWPLPVKSTRYFNNPSAEAAYKVALFGGQDQDRWQRFAKNRLKKLLLLKDYKNLSWYFRFYFFEQFGEDLFALSREAYIKRMSKFSRDYAHAGLSKDAFTYLQKAITTHP